MADALRVSQAPLIASHSNAYAKCPSPRNVPDDILALVAKNGGVIMVNFYSGFVVPDGAVKAREARKELKARYPDPKEYAKAAKAYFKENPLPRGTVSDVVDHIDYIVKTAGIDHVGLGADFDGVDRLPVGLEDVSSYPRVTEELLKRGYSDSDIHKIMSGNVIRAFREAGKVAERLQKTTQPEVDQPVKEAKE
jgi:membrane dipeptidase